MRDRHFPRLCRTCDAPMARQDDTYWRCGAQWASEHETTSESPAAPGAAPAPPGAALAARGAARASNDARDTRAPVLGGPWTWPQAHRARPLCSARGGP
jgi:hypothetical protein